jgi:predicted dehydrogenase
MTSVMSASTPSPLRVAIIGAGQVADKVHASYYATRSDVQMVAVMDSRLNRHRRLRNVMLFRRHGRTREMLEAVKPDVVSVCSPNRFHFEHVMAALEAGCHVMCEKPPAMTPQEADEMRIAARKAGKVLAYDFHHRFALDTQLLREAVMNGTLGEIYFTSAQALRRCGVPGWGVFTNKALQGGGPLIDIGIHMLDAAMYVLGFPAVKGDGAQLSRGWETGKAAASLASGIPRSLPLKMPCLAPLNSATAAFCVWTPRLR